MSKYAIGCHSSNYSLACGDPARILERQRFNQHNSGCNALHNLFSVGPVTFQISLRSATHVPLLRCKISALEQATGLTS